MKVNLVTFSNKGSRKDFPLKGESMIIGRKTDADVRIPLSEVSRVHCEVAVNGKKVVLRDLGSSNGTLVNDQKIAQATLKAGDQVRVGPVTFIVQIEGQPKDVQPPQPRRSPAAKPSAKTPAIAASKKAPAGADTEEIDFDAMEELDVDDLSDLDIDGLANEIAEEDLDEVDEIDGEVEELDEADLVDEEESDEDVKR